MTLAITSEIWDCNLEIAILWLTRKIVTIFSLAPDFVVVNLDKDLLLNYEILTLKDGWCCFLVVNPRIKAIFTCHASIKSIAKCTHCIPNACHLIIGIVHVRVKHYLDMKNTN